MTIPTEEARTKALLDAKGKSEDTFEKNLTYITAGALGVSITLIKSVVPLTVAHCRRLIVLSWVLLLSSLIINLLTHGVTADFVHRKMGEYEKSKNDADKSIEKSINNYNSVLKVWNWFAVILLILGIGCMVIFCSINIL